MAPCGILLSPGVFTARPLHGAPWTVLRPASWPCVQSGQLRGHRAGLTGAGVCCLLSPGGCPDRSPTELPLAGGGWGLGELAVGHPGGQWRARVALPVSALLRASASLSLGLHQRPSVPIGCAGTCAHTALGGPHIRWPARGLGWRTAPSQGLPTQCFWEVEV